MREAIHLSLPPPSLLAQKCLFGYSRRDVFAVAAWAERGKWEEEEEEEERCLLPTDQPISPAKQASEPLLLPLLLSLPDAKKFRLLSSSFSSLRVVPKAWMSCTLWSYGRPVGEAGKEEEIWASRPRGLLAEWMPQPAGACNIPISKTEK